MAATVLGLFLPTFLADPYLVTVLVRGLTLGLAGLAVGLLNQQLGLVSFGIGAFFGLSCYAFSILTTRFGWGPTAAAAVALLGVIALAALLGAVVVRVKALSFVMVTLAIAQAFFVAAGLAGLKDLTGGDDGLLVEFSGELAGLRQSDLLDPESAWPLVWTVVVVVVALTAVMVRSRFGTRLRAIKQNEERMRYSGFDPYRDKILVFVVSAAIAAVAGVLQALTQGLASPDILGFHLSGNALVAALIGGSATVIGPMVGGVVFAFGQSALSDSGNLQFFVGLSLVVVVVILPGGAVPATIRWTRSAARRVKDRLL
ncbi:branched-chain amino acid ABC transporter permease [Pseudonocardia ailaonensis]|uniref:branched-chain amino acid ABC transporter permease n=1 Tax=Pseudonocardia ailaonensis TaxID=367279 RepID=UPI0031D41EC9